MFDQGCGEIAERSCMKYPRSQNRFPKIFAVVAASLMLPGLALAGTDNGKGNNGQNNGNQNGKTKNGGSERFVGSRGEPSDCVNSFCWCGPASLFASAFAS